jgi:DNA-directed RNA polymerase subunit M/transcription elongation factor TFIIS
LLVPQESTRKTVKESDLYTVDEEPIDTRDLAHRNRYASFPCPICYAVLSIESESQFGTQIVCPECDAAVTVPASLQESFSEKQRKAAEIQASSTENTAADVYGIADGDHDSETSFVAAQPEGTFAVYCGLCNTMMYATKEMVGQTLICSECGREVIVHEPEKPKPKSFQATSFEGGTHYGTQSSPEIFELGKHFPNTRLIPVVCTLCKTRMYAVETDIGQWKTCPDCGTKTEVADVPEEQRILPETVGSEYAVKETPVSKRPTFRVGVDYRTVEGSLDLEHQHQLQKRQKQETQSSEEQPVELIEQKPFTPNSVPGAKPDAYDLEPTAARLIPKPPPLPEVLDSDQPVHVPVGPRPELVHGRKVTSTDPNREVVLGEVENIRRKNRWSLSQTKALSQAEVAAVIYSRPRPPRHPFTTRLFQPFFRNDFYQLFMTIISLGTVPVAAFTWASPEGFRLFEGGIVGVGGGNAFQFLMLTTAGVVTGSYWISLLVTYLLHFFSATSDGDDELGMRPEYMYTDGLFSTGRLVLISFFAAIPGYLIWLLVHLFVLDWQGVALTFDGIFNPAAHPIPFLDNEMGPSQISFLCVTFCLLSHWIFYPILFLSSCETGENKVFYSSNTVKNLFRNPSLWLAFYCYVFPVVAFLACYVYLYFLNGIFWESLFWSGVFFVSFLLAGSAMLVLYFRLLGRLAWVIEAESRKQSEA